MKSTKLTVPYPVVGTKTMELNKVEIMTSRAYNFGESHVEQLSHLVHSNFMNFLVPQKE